MGPSRFGRFFPVYDIQPSLQMRMWRDGIITIESLGEFRMMIDEAMKLDVARHPCLQRIAALSQDREVILV